MAIYLDIEPGYKKGIAASAAYSLYHPARVSPLPAG